MIKTYTLDFGTQPQHFISKFTLVGFCVGGGGIVKVVVWGVMVGYRKKGVYSPNILVKIILIYF